MARVTSIFERNGLRKGRREEREENVLLLLAQKFGQLDAATTERIGALNDAQLRNLLTAVLNLTTLADLDRWLQEAGTSA